MMHWLTIQITLKRTTEIDALRKNDRRAPPPPPPPPPPGSASAPPMPQDGDSSKIAGAIDVNELGAFCFPDTSNIHWRARAPAQRHAFALTIEGMYAFNTLLLLSNSNARAHYTSHILFEYPGDDLVVRSLPLPRSFLACVLPIACCFTRANSLSG
jgi:hypothetical protein